MSSHCMAPRPDILVLFDFLTAGHRFLKGDDNKKDFIAFFLVQLASYAKRFRDWVPYALSSPLHYTRNLVDNNDELEMIVLVWQPGQASRIHDHGGSHCFVAVLQGQVFERRFLRLEDDGSLSSESQHPWPLPPPSRKSPSPPSLSARMPTYMTPLASTSSATAPPPPPSPSTSTLPPSST